MELSNELSIGDLLLRAGTNEIVKQVISKFDRSKKRAENLKALKSSNLEMWEHCAEFLCINLADSDRNKIYTKDTLASRILFQLNALLPSQCPECNQKYVIDLEPEKKPLFHCHMCFRGSHDCAVVSGLHDVLTQASIDLPSSYVWLCKFCKESSVPIESRKRKTPHDSVNITDPAILARLNADTIYSSQVSSPCNESSESFRNQEKFNLNDLNSKLDKVVRERVCEKWYTRGKCPHGLRGKKEHDGRVCEFEHPRYCDKYCCFGTQRNFGCNNGSSCKFFHPVLCKFSVKNKLCTNSECTFIHLKGTRRKENGGVPRPKKGDKAAPAPTATQDSTSAADYGASFLELARLVERMQTCFTREISEIRASLRPNPQYQFPPPHLQSGLAYPQRQYPYPTPLLPTHAPMMQNVPTIPHASS